MADNVSITPGAGATVATDERTIGAAAAHVQRVDEQGATAIATAQVSVGTTATLIAAARDTRKAILILVDPAANAPVFIGPSGVTALSGVRLGPGQAIEVKTTAAVYGLAASGTITCYVMEEYDA